MRWNYFYETWEQECKRKGTWHKWYAWHPVWDRGSGFWLVEVERRGDLGYEGGWNWEYRPVQEEILQTYSEFE